MNSRYCFSCTDYDLEMFQHSNRVTCVFTPFASYPYIHVFDIEDEFSFPGTKQEVDEFVNYNFNYKI